jgi:hypothetical protein
MDKIDSAIIRGMARGPWANYWAMRQEEKGKTLSGMDLYEVAPKTPAWATKWAKNLAEEIVKLNRAAYEMLFVKANVKDYAGTAVGKYIKRQAIKNIKQHPVTIGDLLVPAIAAGFNGDPEKFGFYLGCQATEMGIRWTDDLRSQPSYKIIVPYREFYPTR